MAINYERLSQKREGYWRALNSLLKHMQDEGVLISGKDFENLRENSYLS